MASTPPSPPPPLLRWFGPGLAGLFSLVAFISLPLFAGLPLLSLVGVFLALLAPLPLVHLVATGRPSFLAWGWVAAGLVAAVLLFQQTWLVGVCVGYLLVGAWPAVSVEIWLRRSWGTGRWVAVVTLTALVVVLGVIWAVFLPVQPAQGLDKLMSQATAQAGEMLQSLGVPVAGGEETVAFLVHWTAYLIPSFAALYVLAGVLWLRPRLPLLGLPRGAEPFAEYASEEWLPVGFALGGLGWVFAPEPAKWLAANLLVAVLGLYFVHGLAIIVFYLGRRLGGNRWVRAGVTVFALMSPIALAFSALGLADTFFRLRPSGALDGGKTA